MSIWLPRSPRQVNEASEVANATTTIVDFGAPASQNDILAQTVMAYIRPDGAGEGNLGYVFAKHSSTVSGPRLIVNHNTGSPILTFGAHSLTGTNLPAADSTAGAVVYGKWQHVCGTWDGTLNGGAAGGMAVYIGIAGAPMSSVTSGGGAGSGSTVSDALANLAVWNRTPGDRTFNGLGSWVARWNRVLTTAERLRAQFDGPLSVPQSLIFCWHNGRDYGPYRLTGAKTAVLAGSPGIVPFRSLRNYFLVPTIPDGNTVGSASGSSTVSGVGAAIKRAAGSAAGSSTVSGVGAGVGNGSGVGSSVGSSTVTGVGMSIMLRESTYGNLNRALSSVGLNGTSPKVHLVPRAQVCSDISATARWWAFDFEYQSSVETTPSFDIEVSSPQWHLSTLGDSLTAWRPAYSLDGGATWQRFPSQRAGSIDNTGDATKRTFFGVTVPAGTVMRVCEDIPYDLLDTNGVEAALAGYLTGAHAAKFQPSATAVALPDPAYTPAYSPSILKPHISFMSNAATREDGAAVASWPGYLSILDDPGQQPESGNSKVTVCLMRSNHAGESVSFKVLTAFMNRVLQSDAVGVGLRKYIRFQTAWEYNASGRQSGHWRATHEETSKDYNRHFNDTTSIQTERIKSAFLLECQNQVVAAWFDFHGEGNTTPTLYGRNTTSVPYERYEDKLIAKRADTEFTVDADDGKRSWNWAMDVLGAWAAFICERETIGTPNEADRQLWGEQLAESLWEALAENLLIVVPQGPIRPGEAVEVRFRPAGDALLPSGVTYASGDITPSATNGSFGAVTYVSSGGKQYWTADFTAAAPGAVTMSFTNTQELLSAGTLVTGTAVATRGGAGRGRRMVRH